MMAKKVLGRKDLDFCYIFLLFWLKYGGLKNQLPWTPKMGEKQKTENHIWEFMYA